ncbi:MAG: hypothetical protein U0075_06985 [Thermomicrobiales bacterium]
MDDGQFDVLTRALTMSSRRRAFQSITGVAVGLAGFAQPTWAKTKKKSTLCFNGQTVKASSKKKKKLIKQGATPGACGGPATCAANAECGTGAICVAGVCQPCAVTCDGNGNACGSALNARLAKGGTVYICPGRYIGFFTSNAVTMVGAGMGEDPATNTILDGSDSGRTLSISDGATVSLSRLRITRGNAGSSPGGGIFAKGGDLTIDNCAIEKNRADSGGGIHVKDGRLTMRNTSVAENTGTISGGGIQLLTGFASTIASSRITGNRSPSTSWGMGGGLRVYENTLTITDTEISGNSAMNEGGGIYVYNSTLKLNSGTRVASNSVSPGRTGGGIYSFNADLQLGGATIIGNTPDNIYED